MGIITMDSIKIEEGRNNIAFHWDCHFPLSNPGDFPYAEYTKNYNVTEINKFTLLKVKDMKKCIEDLFSWHARLVAHQFKHSPVAKKEDKWMTCIYDAIKRSPLNDFDYRLLDIIEETANKTKTIIVKDINPILPTGRFLTTVYWEAFYQTYFSEINIKSGVYPILSIEENKKRYGEIAKNL